MFKIIYELLIINELRGKSYEIDIAKGINKLPLTWSELIENVKRKIESK